MIGPSDRVVERRTGLHGVVRNRLPERHVLVVFDQLPGEKQEHFGVFKLSDDALRREER